MLINNAVLTGSFTVNGVNYIANTPSTGSNTYVGTQTISGSVIITGSLDVTGSIATTGTITAQTLVVQTVTSSVVYSSGSNIFGNQLTDVQQMTGSLRVTGSGNHYILGGNVGIGNTTAASKLEITSTNQGNSVTYGSIFNVTTATAINDRLNINFSQNGNNDRARAAIGAVAELANGLASSLAFYTRTAVDGSGLATTDERMRINSAGNIGIGVIPYNWGRADFIPVDVGDLAALATYNTAYSVLTNNIYYNAGWKYKLNGYGNAILLRQDDGAIAFATFGTGTADAAATFSERMRINSNGNTSIGLASDGGTKLYVGGTFTAATTLASGYAHTLANNSLAAGASGVFIDAYSASSSSFALAIRTNDGNSYPFRVRCDGLIATGLQTYSPYNFSVTGNNCYINSSGELGYLSSTRESKANIESIKSVDFINQLNPVQFNYRKKNSETNEYTDDLYDNTNYGFIADEVEKINKDLVFYKSDGTTLAGVEYNNMIAILTKAIQELSQKVTELENIIATK